MNQLLITALVVAVGNKTPLCVKGWMYLRVASEGFVDKVVAVNTDRIEIQNTLYGLEQYDGQERECFLYPTTKAGLCFNTSL